MGDGNARPEERTSERGRELVRAGAFPLVNSRARDGLRDWNKGERKRERKRERERARNKRKDARS